MRPSALRGLELIRELRIRRSGAQEFRTVGARTTWAGRPTLQPTGGRRYQFTDKLLPLHRFKILRHLLPVIDADKARRREVVGGGVEEALAFEPQQVLGQVVY